MPLTLARSAWRAFASGFADHETTGDDSPAYRWSLLYFRWGLVAAYLLIVFVLRPGQDDEWAVASAVYLVIYQIAHTIHTSIHTGRGRPVYWFYEGTPLFDIAAISLIMASASSLLFPIWAAYLLVIFGASVARRGSYVATLTAASLLGYALAALVQKTEGRPVSVAQALPTAILITFGGWFSTVRARLERGVYDTLRTSQNRTQAMYDLAHALGRAGDLQVVYTAALDAIERTLDIRRAAALLFDPDGVMRFKAWRGLSDSYRQAVEGHSPWPRDAKNPQPLLVSDVAADPTLDGLRHIITAEGIAAMAFIPIVYQDHLLGKFMVYYPSPHQFTPDEVHLLQTIASHVSYAVERKRSEETIARLAFHDPLTGLPNRRVLEDRMTVALAQARRRDGSLAVVSLDLDRFKQVNDHLGHTVGDALLCAVAQRLSALVREGDTVARVGGDEFLFLLPHVSTIDDAVAVAERTLQAFDQPFVFDANTVRITPSIGISLYPQNGHTAEALIQTADAAMYRAKKMGRNNYQIAAATPAPSLQD